MRVLLLLLAILAVCVLSVCAFSTMPPSHLINHQLSSIRPLSKQHLFFHHRGAVHSAQRGMPSAFVPSPRPFSLSVVVSSSPSSSSSTTSSTRLQALSSSSLIQQAPTALLSLEESASDKMHTLVIRAIAGFLIMLGFLWGHRRMQREEIEEQERVLREVEKFKSWNSNYIKGAEEEKKKKEEEQQRQATSTGEKVDVERAQRMRRKLWKASPRELEGIRMDMKDPGKRINLPLLKMALSRNLIDVTPDTPEAPTELKMLIQDLKLLR